jgi:hypothetical protein
VLSVQPVCSREQEVEKRKMIVPIFEVVVVVVVVRYHPSMVLLD